MGLSLFTNGVDKSLDILKSYLFVTQIMPNPRTQLETIYKQYGGENNAITIRARQAKWGGKQFEDLATIFMGSKVNYPGMPKVDGDLKIQFDEFQDTLVIKFMTAWMNLIFNSNFSPESNASDNSFMENVTQGGSSSVMKKDYSADISVYITDSTTNNLVPIYCKFYNCYPRDFAEMSLDATQNGNVKPDITFRYDYFEFKSSNNSTSTNINEGPVGGSFGDVMLG